MAQNTGRLQCTQKLTLRADGETEGVKLTYTSGTTVDDLTALLWEQPYSFYMEWMTFRGDSGMLENIGGTRPVQTLVERNGTISFEGKKPVPSGNRTQRARPTGGPMQS